MTRCPGGVERWLLRGLRSPSSVVAVTRHGRRSPLIRAQEKRRCSSRRGFSFAATAATRYTANAAATLSPTADAASDARRVPQLLRGGTDAENAGSDRGGVRVASYGSPCRTKEERNFQVDSGSCNGSDQDIYVDEHLRTPSFLDRTCAIVHLALVISMLITPT